MNLPPLPERGATKLTLLPPKTPVAAVQHATAHALAPGKLDKPHRTQLRSGVELWGLGPAGSA
eukprot:1420425-Rhodomonas_salina.1